MPLPAPETKNVKVGLAAFEMGTLAARVARQEGIFKEYGLDVELVQLEGDGPAAQALVAGQLDGSIMGGAPVLSAKAAGTDLKMVFVTNVIPTDVLATPIAVASGADLKGKQVAISTFGGDSHLSVVLGLKALNLTPQDVTIVQIGGQGDRLAAVLAGAVSAAPIEGISDADLAKQGLHALIKLSETDLELARAGLVLPQEFIEKNPNTTLNLVAALLDANTRMLAHPEIAYKAMAEATDISLKEATQKVEPNLPFVSRDGRANVDMFEPQKTVLITVNPEAAGVNTAEAFTNEFIDTLEADGYFAKFGVKTS